MGSVFAGSQYCNSSACCAGVFSGIHNTWLNMDHLYWFALTDSGTTLHILYKASLESTLSGQRWPVMVRSVCGGRHLAYPEISLELPSCYSCTTSVTHRLHRIDISWLSRGSSNLESTVSSRTGEQCFP